MLKEFFSFELKTILGSTIILIKNSIHEVCSKLYLPIYHKELFSFLIYLLQIRYTFLGPVNVICIHKLVIHNKTVVFHTLFIVHIKNKQTNKHLAYNVLDR